MRSISVAVVATSLLAVGAGVAVLVSDHLDSVFASRGELQLVERVAFALSTRYLRSLPYLTIGIVGGAAVIGGCRNHISTAAALYRERRAWIAFAVVAMAFNYALFWAINHGLNLWWTVGASVAAGGFLGACIGILAATVRIYRWRGTGNAR